MKLTPTMPSACCWRTASLSHMRTCSTISLGSPLGSVWKRKPSQPWASLVPLKLLVATVSAKTKKFVWSPRVRGQPVDQELVLVVQHELQPLARDVARRLAVDGVAEDHVVGGDRLGDRPRGAAGLEEFAGDLLAGADLGERAVLRHVQVDGQRLLVRGEEFLLLAHARHIGRRAAGVATRSCVTSPRRRFRLVEGPKAGSFTDLHEEFHHLDAGCPGRARDLRGLRRPALRRLHRRHRRHGRAEEGPRGGVGLLPGLRPVDQHHRRAAALRLRRV